MVRLPKNKVMFWLNLNYIANQLNIIGLIIMLSKIAILNQHSLPIQITQGSGYLNKNTPLQGHMSRQAYQWRIIAQYIAMNNKSCTN